MKILVLNSGSSSLKSSLFVGKHREKIAEVIVGRIWETISDIKICYQDTTETKELCIKNHSEALESIVEIFLSKKILKSISDITAVWHRVVHGWVHFSDSVIINDEVKWKIKECIEIAPLHNPINFECIELAEKLFPKSKQIAVFDTAFHQTIPKKNYLYAIPKKYYEKYKIRKYGFHGISHKYVYEKLMEDTDDTNQKVISCHIGNGASITAIHEGKSINTSMWFTPVDWLVMGTRAWDIDPSVVLFLQEKENLSSQQLNDLINKHSGVLWLTWVVADLRDVEEWIALGNPDYELALDIYVSRIVRFIGAYIADLWGVDTIIFTAWVLENSSNIRKRIAQKLEFAWVEFDEFQNLFRGEERTISTNYSKTRLIVIPTDEEMMIAKEVGKLI